MRWESDLDWGIYGWNSLSQWQSADSYLVLLTGGWLMWWCLDFLLKQCWNSCDTGSVSNGKRKHRQLRKGCQKLLLSALGEGQLTLEVWDASEIHDVG
jgi:hypothetical protein